MTITISQNMKIVLEKNFNQISFILFFSNDNKNFQKKIFTQTFSESQNYFFIEDFKYFNLIITELDNQKFILYIENDNNKQNDNNIENIKNIENMEKSQLPQLFDNINSNNINSLGLLGMFKGAANNVNNTNNTNNIDDNINVVIKKK
jgi:hypothetical protein